MSGLFLLVTDETNTLEATAGGPPHVTVAYTGKHVARANLCFCLNGLMLRFLRPSALFAFTLDRAELSSFQRANGAWRHDVLLMVRNTEAVDESRETIRALFPDVCDKFAMLPPHVTAATCDTLDEANTALARFEKCLPLTVDVTGVYLDS